MSIEFTGPIDDGWRPLDDPEAPKSGHCWLANKDKTMAWESHDGAGGKPNSMWDVEAHWWRLSERP